MSAGRTVDAPGDLRDPGSARTGVAHWWMQRVTAVALVPLTLWFAAGLVAIAGRGHEVFVAWLGSLHATILAILLLIALFHHMALGLQVVIEDYVHAPGSRSSMVLAVRLGCAALAVAGTVSVVRIALGG